MGLCGLVLKIVLPILSIILVAQLMIDNNLITGFMGLKPGKQGWDDIVKQLQNINATAAGDDWSHQIRTLVAPMIFSPKITFALVLAITIAILETCRLFCC